MQGISDLFVDGIVRVLLSDLSSNDSKPGKCIFLQHPDYQYSMRNVSELPLCGEDNSRVVIVSDTHDSHHKIQMLPPCDLLVHCGDIMMTSKHFSHKNCLKKIARFNAWLSTCEAKQRIVLAGNHDQFLEKIGSKMTQELLRNALYLENSGCNLSNLTVWGSPVSNGRSPNRAFQSKDFLAKTMQQKPEEVDILITHGLCEELTSSIKHKIHIWGHSHNSYGIRYPGDAVKVHSHVFQINSLSLCVPLMDGRFKMRNLPVVIDVPRDREKLNCIPMATDMIGHLYAGHSEKKKKSHKYAPASPILPPMDDDACTGAEIPTMETFIPKEQSKPTATVQVKSFSMFGLFQSYSRVQPGDTS